MNVIEVKKLEDAARSSFGLLEDEFLPQSRVENLKLNAKDLFSRFSGSFSK